MSRICRSLYYLILPVQVGFQIILCLQIILSQITYIYIYIASNQIPTRKTQKGCYKFTKLFLPIGPSNLYHALTILLELKTMLQITRFIKPAPLPICVNPSNKTSTSAQPMQDVMLLHVHIRGSVSKSNKIRHVYNNTSMITSILMQLLI